MAYPPDYYKDEDPVKTALRKSLIRSGNKILKETNKSNLNPDRIFVRDAMAYLKLEQKDADTI